jgi:hypothetical protein
MPTGYETVIDPSTIVWTAAAMLIHGATIAMQIALIVYLLAIAALATIAPAHDSPWLSRLGALQPNSENRTRTAALFAALAVLLLLPFLLGAPAVLSLLALVAIAATVILYEQGLAPEARPRGRYARHTAIALAALLSVFGIWEREDPLALGTELVATAQGWRMHELDWQRSADRATPRVGDLAPDFSLQDPSGEVAVRLSDFRGKRPVALVFGSYT